MTDGSVANIVLEDRLAVITFNFATMPAGVGIEALAGQLSELIIERRPYGMVVDFTGVKFFSSQTLGVILDARKKISAYDGKIVISGIDPQLYRVFKITNLDKIFEFFPVVGEAIDFLKTTKKK
ncbi:MAG: STAS domain-containing protein [Anaerohalosphaeraceae bacterium]|nr:STAS domain-containing protein [Anaerohalosphaeraceae bacterium]